MGADAMGSAGSVMLEVRAGVVVERVRDITEELYKTEKFYVRNSDKVKVMCTGVT